jgi:hypothetical protein
MSIKSIQLISSGESVIACLISPLLLFEIDLIAAQKLQYSCRIFIETCSTQSQFKAYFLPAFAYCYSRVPACSYPPENTRVRIVVRVNRPLINHCNCYHANGRDAIAAALRYGHRRRGKAVRGRY